MPKSSMFLVLICWIAPGSVFAADLLVDGTVAQSGNNTFKTVAEALDACEHGDRILIRALDDRGKPIIYFEQNLIVDRSIELTSLEASQGGNVRATIRGPFLLRTDNYDPNNEKHMENARAQQAFDFPQQKPVLHIAADAVTVSYLAIEGATKTGILASSLTPNARLHRISITHCSTFMTFSSGILLNRISKAEVGNCVIRRACQYGWQECLTLNDTHFFSITNCIVYDKPRLRIPLEIPANENSEIILQNGQPIQRGGEGIDAKSGSRHGEIRQNLVASIAKFGIYVDAYDKESFDIDIVNNFVFNTGSGISIATEAGGLTHDIRVHGNVVALCAAGFYMNDHGLGPTHEVQNVEVYFNTFFANRVAGINITNNELQGLTVANNVSINNGGTDITIASDGGTILNFSNNVAGVVKYEGNLIAPGFIDPARQFQFDEFNQIVSDAVLEGDLVWDSAEWDVPWEMRIAQQWLWNPTLYSPLAGSAAMDFGAEIGTDRIRGFDVFGNLRPKQTTDLDLGAVESSDGN